MIQEIIVIALFTFIIGYYVYRIFFRKDSTPSGSCSKCVSNKEPAAAREERSS